MRRTLSFAVALAIGVAGCKSSDTTAPTPPASKGTHGVNYWVTASAAGGLVTSAGGALNCGDTCGAFFQWDASATLTATPYEGYTFRAWAGDCTADRVSGTTCTLPSGATLGNAADRMAVAIFDVALPPAASHGTHGTDYWVSVSGPGGDITSGDGAIACGATCSALIAWATPVTLTATPAAGYAFRAWAGACTPDLATGNTCALPSGAALGNAADRVAVAIFDPVPPPAASHGTFASNFWVSASGLGGTVTSGDGQIDCGTACGALFPWASPVTLTATAGTGYAFRAWAGDCAGVVETTCTLPSGATVGNAADRLAVAVFDALPPPPPGTPPALATLAAGGRLTESTIELLAQALDPDAAETITCNWTVVSQPVGSVVDLASAPADCRAADLVATVVPHVPGTYVFRASASDGTTTTTEDVTAVVTPAFVGGVVAGTQATLPADYTAIRDRLIQIQANVGTVAATAAAKEYMDALAAATPSLPYNAIDVRDPADFAAGHIPGAINVPFALLPDILLGNPNFPEARTLALPARKVLVAGYYAADSIEASFLVNAARCGTYGCTGTGTTNPIPAAQRSYSLGHGMSSWTYDVSVSPFRFDDDLGVHRMNASGADVSTAAYVAPAATNPFPALAPFAGTPTVTQQVLVRARQWLAWQEADAAQEGVAHREAFHTNFIRWDRLKKDSDPANDPTLVVFQSAAQWTAGHPVATETAPVLQTTAALLNAGPSAGNVFQQIDPAKPVYVCCFSGISEVPPTIMLGVLGYKSRAILYGISGWTTSTASGANLSAWDAGANGNDFPLAKAATDPCADPAGASCAAAFGATPDARAGCERCHANYAAHYYDIALTPPPGAAIEVQSEGEG